MGGELYEEMGLWSPSEGWETSINHPVAGSYRAIGLDLQGASPEQAARLEQQLEQTKAKLNSADTTQLATLTKHNVVGNLLYATVFNYFALNDLQDRIAAQSSHMLNYRLPSFGTFSTDLNTQYWYGLPRNVVFGGLSMDIDHMKNQRMSKTNNANEAIAFTQSIGARMSAMEHLVPEQMFSTDIQKAQGISAVKALSIASQQGQKIWTITNNNLELALSRINLSDEAEMDIRNAVNAGKIATAHENRINFNGWIGEGYTLIDPQTGAGAYIISGGGNGAFLVIAGLAGLMMFAIALPEIFALGATTGALLAEFAYLNVAISMLLQGLSLLVRFFGNDKLADQLCTWGGYAMNVAIGAILGYLATTSIGQLISPLLSNAGQLISSVVVAGYLGNFLTDFAVKCK